VASCNRCSNEKGPASVTAGRAKFRDKRPIRGRVWASADYHNDMTAERLVCGVCISAGQAQAPGRHDRRRRGVRVRRRLAVTGCPVCQSRNPIFELSSPEPRLRIESRRYAVWAFPAFRPSRTRYRLCAPERLGSRRGRWFPSVQICAVRPTSQAQTRVVTKVPDWLWSWETQRAEQFFNSILK
jgi:hypothetical protein